MKKSDATLFACKNLTADDRLLLKKYRYRVDADTQFGTRAMRRELEVRVEQVDLMDDSDGSVARTGEQAKVDVKETESDALPVSGIKI